MTSLSGDQQPAALDVTSLRTAGAVRLRLTGEIDIATAPYLLEVLDEVAGDPPAAVHLDLGRVTFIDAAGLGALVHARTLMAGRGARLVLADVPARIRLLLELTALLDTFAIDEARHRG
jgi:anti-sigma B factor antagonist